MPPQVQARLVSKAVGYDQHLAGRVGAEVSVALLSKGESAVSARAAGHMGQALAEEKLLAGRPHREMQLAYLSPHNVAEHVVAARIAVLYVMPGFSDDEVRAIARALIGLDVLTIAATPLDVQHGMVLGFDLVSGKARLLVNVAQARRQNVKFSAEFMQLARVIE